MHALRLRLHADEARAHERAITFRHLFAAEIEEFLRAERLDFGSAVDLIGEIVIELATYREEGTPLFPEVFLCRDVDAAVSRLGGIDPIMLGRASLDPSGAQWALKRTAPLSCAGWSVLLCIEEDSSTFAYGLFRTDPFVLQPSSMDRLRAIDRPARTPLIGIAPLEENVIELRASANAFQHVYLSGARADTQKIGPMVVDRLVSRLGGPLEDHDVRDAVRVFWRRVLGDALRMPHGVLVAVVRSERDLHARFPDASHLSPPIDVPRHVAAYLVRRDESSRAAVHALAGLIEGMLRADGITVLREDGAVLAFHAFVAHRPSASSYGGARWRTYETLAAEVGGTDGLVAAFYNSQDGGSAMT